MANITRVSSAATSCASGLGLPLGRRLCSAPRFRIAAKTRTGSRCSPFVPRAVMNVSEANFEEEVLKSDKTVLVDYWATWCGPCKLVAPLMDWCEKEYDIKVVKIETDPNPNLVEKYKVYGLPTLMLFKDGKVVEGSHSEGAVSKKSLASYMSQYGIEANTAL